MKAQALNGLETIVTHSIYTGVWFIHHISNSVNNTEMKDNSRVQGGSKVRGSDAQITFIHLQILKALGLIDYI